MTCELERVAKLGWDLAPESEDGVRYFRGTSRAAVNFPDQGLEALGLEGGVGYWFDHRAAAVSRSLVRLRVESLWEVGSGTGAMASRLLPTLTEVVTVEPLAQGARSAAKLGLPALCGTLQDLRLPRASVTCIGAFDVIEHIFDVAEFLGEVRRVLIPGGIVVVTVPAFSLMWGEEDDVAGHERRYTRRSLVSQFQESGFTPVHTEYLYASLVAPAALTRALPYRLGRRRSEAKVLANLESQLNVRDPIDQIARRILAAETALARFFRLPFGLTVLGEFRAT